MLERALNAPPRFSRRRFLATSTTASLAFTLASQPGRLSADGTATESSGSNGGNPSNTGQPWTIELNHLSEGDGMNDGPDKLAFNWKNAVDTTKGGTPFLLAIRWRLEPECFVAGVKKRKDEWTYRYDVLAQVRVDPGPMQNLPQDYEDYMSYDNQFYRTLLLDATGKMNFKVVKSGSEMKCVLGSANNASDQENKEFNGKKWSLLLQTHYTPPTMTAADVLVVQPSFGASVVEAAISSSYSKWGLKVKLDELLAKVLGFELTYDSQPPPASTYTMGIKTECSATFKAVSGSPNYSC